VATVLVGSGVKLPPGKWTKPPEPASPKLETAIEQLSRGSAEAGAEATGLGATSTVTGVGEPNGGRGVRVRVVEAVLWTTPSSSVAPERMARTATRATAAPTFA
jgi:hypothetical protein